MSSFTIFATFTLQPEPRHVVEVNGDDTVEGLKKNLAEEFNVEAQDVTLQFEGAGLEGGKVCDTVLAEGSEVVVGVSRGYEAKMRLKEMRVGWSGVSLLAVIGKAKTGQLSEEKTLETVTLQLEAGADHTQVGGMLDSTALHYMCKGKYTSVIEVLLSAGCSPTARNVAGDTPMHSAAQNDNIPAIELFAKHGADFTMKNGRGSTPLHSAAACGNLSVVKYLVGHGVDTCEEDIGGFTPLKLAEMCEAEDVAQYLRSL